MAMMIGAALLLVVLVVALVLRWRTGRWRASIVLVTVVAAVVAVGSVARWLSPEEQLRRAAIAERDSVAAMLDLVLGEGSLVLSSEVRSCPAAGGQRQARAWGNAHGPEIQVTPTDPVERNAALQEAVDAEAAQVAQTLRQDGYEVELQPAEEGRPTSRTVLATGDVGTTRVTVYHYGSISVSTLTPCP